MRTRLVLLSVAALALVCGCPAQPGAPQFDTGTAPHDTGVGTHDVGTVSDGGHDAGSDTGSVVVMDAGDDAASATDDAATDDAGTDAASAMDDAGTDAAVADDAGNDAASGTDGGNPCVNAGGMCVPLVPGSCTGGTVGPESCGGGLGVECCHAGTTTSAAPVCMMTGTAQEGWYEPDGSLICVISCAGLTARCQRIGTPSQGWYTTSGHGCPPHSQEILGDATCM